jgi:hypothetical protein
MQMAGDRLVLDGSFDLPLGRKEKPEGIDFAGPSRLLVVTDDSAKLLEFAVRRKRMSAVDGAWTTTVHGRRRGPRS